MNKLFLVVLFLFGVISTSISQKSLSDYSYVIVSEQFEFQKDKDKYQLNSLTKFLFNKHGFHAYFDRELPINLKRCDGLWAEAEGTPGFIITKIQLVLRDCYGMEVYRTQFGTSKEKDYKKAYYESMREAFSEIEAMEIKQKDIEEIGLVKSSDNSEVQKEEVAVVSTDAALRIESVKKSEVKEVISQELLITLPTAKYTTYSYKGKNILLQKTSNGYSLYQEVIGAEEDLLLIGKIKIEDSLLIFENDENEKTNAFFNESKNLIIGDGNKKIEYIFEN